VPRYAAFLRGVNISGRVVKMDALRKHLEKLGLSDVETVIASGNVLFSSASKNAAALEKKIHLGLHKALGYPVAIYVRTDAQIAALAGHRPFGDAKHKAARVFLVGFIAEPLSKDAARTLLALAAGTEEELHTKGSEIFWLCKNGQSVSPLFRVPIEKRIGTLITWRNMNTIERIHAKFSAR
jgi:uncharacterized protein (DUF1697 family)